MPEDHQPLRILRRLRHCSIEYVAAEAGISYKCLSEIEREVTHHPPRGTLCKILTALDRCAPVSAEDRSAVYMAYGYHPPYPLPTDDEIAKVRRCWHAYCAHMPQLAYLMDVSQRVLEWNPLAPRLVGLRAADRHTQYFRNATSFDLAFDLAQRFVTIENDAAYRRSFVHTLKRELQPYTAEDWCTACIAAAQRRYPEFKRLWEAERLLAATSPTGGTLPIELRLPEYASPLAFQRVKSPFVGDARFQTVLWLPVGITTTQVCLAWACEVCPPSGGYRG
ncbi:MAG TPA: hypothetical protein PKZ84_02405 [Anaerolineae bacterium]|nr:hypothetical protein [Anaerolineae bacterium]HQI83149.1 hypothetical protein [Anaerolineae bacterium]